MQSPYDTGLHTCAGSQLTCALVKALTMFAEASPVCCFELLVFRGLGETTARFKAGKGKRGIFAHVSGDAASDKVRTRACTGARFR